MDDYKEVVAAIVAAGTEMPSLIKGDRNQHGGYNFVSVDKYYEEVASVALKNGISWKFRETASDLVDTGRAMAMRFAYAVDVIHGPSGKVWSDFFTTSILHPLQGAQTAGSALSYADKLFMRTTFHIVTGEGDADSTNGNELNGEKPAKAKPVERVSVVSEKDVDKGEPFEARVWIDTMLTFLPLAKSIDEVNAYWTTNDKLIQQIMAADEAGYGELRQAFLVRRRELKGK